jgi:hypothetical protein
MIVDKDPTPLDAHPRVGLPLPDLDEDDYTTEEYDEP